MNKKREPFRNSMPTENRTNRKGNGLAVKQKQKKKWTKQIELCEIILGMFVFQLFQILNYLHFPHRGFLNHLPTFCYVVAIDATENTNSSIHAFEYTTTISRKLEAVVEFNFFSSLFFLLSYSFIWFVCFFFLSLQ